MSNLFQSISKTYQDSTSKFLSIADYLKLCKKDTMAYATAYERMLKAIGNPEIVDTSRDAKLSRIYLNRPIKIYPAFKEFYGIEEVVEKVVGYFTHAAQGLEESKQILYLAGGVGSGKSSLAEKLKKLMEVYPIYVLVDENNEVSPVFESPLGLFISERDLLEEEFGIPARYVPKTMSPWAAKRLNEYGGDVTKFKVAKLKPSELNKIAIAKTEPLDDNNADISALIGKVDLRKLQDYSQHDPDAYAYNGGLCRGNQGLVEMVEMFKSNIKTLNPLLEATQSRSFAALEPIGSIPFEGIILSHSNMTEFESFRADKKNEAFLDRVYMVKTPYCLRYDDDAKIIEKMVKNSKLNESPCVPETYTMLSQFCVLSRLEDHTNSNLFSKMRVYNGDNVKNEDNHAKPLQEYKDNASQDEGLNGISTRWAFKLLAKAFNYDSNEIAADPVTLMMLLEQKIVEDQFPKNTQEKYLAFIKDWLAPKYAEKLGKQIQRAYIESHNEYCQNRFDRYIELANCWLEDIDFRNPETGNLMDRKMINEELESIEKTANIYNARDFRNEVVMFVLRKSRSGENVKWDSYPKLGDVIESSIFKNFKEMLPIISFGTKTNKKDAEDHDNFIHRLCEQGYTEKQTKRLVEWYIRYNNS